MIRKVRKVDQDVIVNVIVDQPSPIPVTAAPIASGKRSLESLRDLVGLVSASTGIFAVLLYLAGRSFAGGYFEAMNIPSYQVSFSIWEYGEVGWLPMLLYPIRMMIFSGIFWGGLAMLDDWLKIKLPQWHLPRIGHQAHGWFKLVLR